jgi:hypothetical protein
VSRQRPCDGLIPRPRSAAGCVKDQETEKAAKDQQRVVEPWIDRSSLTTDSGASEMHIHPHTRRNTQTGGFKKKHIFLFRIAEKL